MELRLGYISELYTSFLGIDPGSQLDILEEWFPGLIITVREKPGKQEAEYVDHEYRIYASREHGKLYSGGSRRISQITGRLIGTAKGNQEKERKTAELIRRHLAALMVTDMDLLTDLQKHIYRHIESFSDEQMNAFGENVLQAVLEMADKRAEMDEYSKNSEPFPMDDECFDGILYNAAYQLTLYDRESLATAYLWLLIGGLLRNEAGRVQRMFDSSLVPVHRQSSEDGTLRDKIHFLFFPEEYEPVYYGDDFDRKHPGVEWYCDQCLEHLNEQDGFDDHLPVWQCRVCGWLNDLDSDEIYENREDAMNGVRRSSARRMEEAVARRKAELQEDS